MGYQTLLSPNSPLFSLNRDKFAVDNIRTVLAAYLGHPLYFLSCFDRSRYDSKSLLASVKKQPFWNESPDDQVSCHPFISLGPDVFG